MPEAPTYREEQEGETRRYVCLVPDASQEAGICGFWTWAEPDLQQHLNQRHAGVIVKAPLDAGAEGAPPGDSLMPPPAAASPSPSTEPEDIPDPVPPATGG